MRLISEEVTSVISRIYFFASFTLDYELLQHPQIIDPSELLRPEAEFAGKSLSKFRDYTIDVNDPLKERVRQTYRQMHLNQTVDFVKSEFSNVKLYEIKNHQNTFKCQLR